MKEATYIWKNGELIPWADAKTHVLTHALHYATSVFEGIRAYSTADGPAIFRSKEHYDRLVASAKTYYLKMPYSVDEMTRATVELIQANTLKSCYIRPIVYSGYSEMGINHMKNPVDVVIAAWEWGSYLGDDGVKNGIRVTISPWEKFSSRALPATAKCAANYANSVLAKIEALDRGFDEALLFNQSGMVAEGPGENLFLIKDGKIYTPPVSEDALDGITRSSVMEIISDLGFSIEERIISREALFDADELFFTGTAAEVTPIREIDGTIIGSGTAGIITKQIQDTYFKAVNGELAQYRKWLTPILLPA
ncbi:MAG: branched-chain amino acid transaminase [bacterium]|nr:branched-chain amino acid transaminase [bacterium]